MSRKEEDKGLEKAVTKQIANYLFEKPGDNEAGEFLDIRTDVNTKNMFNALLYYRVLGSYFKSNAATLVANILERLSISSNREGRREAVISLLQKLPSPKYLPAGLDELMHKLQDGEFLSGDSSESRET